MRHKTAYHDTFTTFWHTDISYTIAGTDKISALCLQPGTERNFNELADNRMPTQFSVTNRRFFLFPCDTNFAAVSF